MALDDRRTAHAPRRLHALAGHGNGVSLDVLCRRRGTPRVTPVELEMLLFGIALFITMGIGAGCAFLWDQLTQ
jgi:hypothetical protein